LTVFAEVFTEVNAAFAFGIFYNKIFALV